LCCRIERAIKCSLIGVGASCAWLLIVRRQKSAKGGLLFNPCLRERDLCFAPPRATESRIERVLFSTLVFFRREQAQILRRRRLPSERERRLADYTYTRQIKNTCPRVRARQWLGVRLRAVLRPGALRGQILISSLSGDCRIFRKARLRRWCADQLIADARLRESENKNTPTPKTRRMYVVWYTKI
jgi:hypothetical protein